ncbi:hypothetical protein CB1_000188012 [Camelus ferus]|nr:hypothetical protein CB1_000188012 [Camelus ferus]
MECRNCRHISKEEGAKFCSQCGHKLLRVAPVPDSENNLKATSAPKGEMEGGQELMEDSSSFSSLGSDDWQEAPGKPCSEASWQIQTGVASEGFVDAGDGTSDELEAASSSPCKRRKEDAALFEVADAAEQEAKTKDQTAVPEGKAGETCQKAKPQDPKKSEGNGRSDAAAVKGKEQRNQSADAQGAEESPLSSAEGITVCFHAIVSEHFEFDPSKHKIFVRGGEELGKPKWSHNVCEMYYTKDLGKNRCLVEGSTVISRQHVGTPIPYKYVVSRGKGTVDYEFIYKPQQKEGEHVNRCLKVKPSLLGSGDWHQYDDIICMNSPGMWQRMKDRLTDGTRKDLVKGKQTAAAVMLDGIFSILETWNTMNLKSFFTQFQQFYSVIRVPMIYEGEEQQWSALQYKEEEVPGSGVSDSSLLSPWAVSATPLPWPDDP